MNIAMARNNMICSNLDIAERAALCFKVKRRENMFKKSCVGIFLLFLFLVASLQAQVKVLYSFADSSSPFESPILKGSTLYGMTRWGGASSNGTIYKIQTNGTGFKILHVFAGGTADGRVAYGSLVSGGSTSPWLYGMTEYGGVNNNGTIFKIQTNGTGYQVIHSFAGGAADGRNPSGSLIRIGSTLYGMTPGGGVSNRGTIFKIQTNGTGFDVLHSFAGGATDGGTPMGSLKAMSSTLYGMTFGAGAYASGTLFKIQTNGTGFKLLYSFGANAADGTDPQGSLISINSTLYGMTLNGGAGNHGTVFKIKTDGTGYVLLHSFAAGTTDGASPYGSLKAIGSALYGMTIGGGTAGLGTIFKINTNGTQFMLLHSFLNDGTDGQEPFGSLIASVSTFYGVTSGGGAYGDYNKGTIFSFKKQ